jgi:hypothetical protein
VRVGLVSAMHAPRSGGAGQPAEQPAGQLGGTAGHVRARHDAATETTGLLEALGGWVRWAGPGMMIQR